MDDIIKRFTLDLQKNSSSEVVYACKHDIGRTIQVSIVNNGMPLYFTDNTTAMLSAKKDDEPAILEQCTMSGNIVRYTISANITEDPCEIPCEIILYGAGGNRITSPAFTISVAETNYSDGEPVADPVEPTVVLMSPGNAKVGQYFQISEVGEDGRAVKLTPSDGTAGKSAYEFAVEGGYTGTETEFAEKMAEDYLPLSGGTVAGELNVQGSVYASTVYLGAGMYAPGDIEWSGGYNPETGTYRARISNTEFDGSVILGGIATPIYAFDAASKGYVDEAVKKISSMSFHICSSNEIAADGIPNIGQPSSDTIYFTPSHEEYPDLFIEWVYVDDNWERFGSAIIDLTGYVKNTDYATKEKAGVVHGTDWGGVGINAGGGVFIQRADMAMIDAKVSIHYPLTPSLLDYAIKTGITTNTIELTAEEQAAAQNWLGVTALVGDIETALDNIIAIQNSLIDGDGTVGTTGQIFVVKRSDE